VPLGRARVGRPGMVGRRVACTAAAVGTATVVSHGVNRRMDRRDMREMRSYDRVFR